MTNIRPFKAVVYNPEKVKDLSGVACPPYDVISASRQEYYYNLSPYNFIHILLSRAASGKDKYQQAEYYFREWLKNKVLIRDREEAVYFYSHQYNIKGEKKTRFGFIALLEMGENSSVFAHEHTRLEAKEDRLRLLQTVKANLSPIFVLFPDKKRIIKNTFQQYLEGRIPFINIIDEEKNTHQVWRVDAPEILESIQARIRDENIFIADGHHRYEVACAYRDEVRARLGAGAARSHDSNYVMTYFTNIESPGLTILPIHRLVTLDGPPATDELIKRLKDNFYAEEVKDRAKFFFLLEKAGRTEHILGMYKDKRFWFLRLRNIKILDKMIGDKPREYRSLDVSILNFLILKDILKLDLDDKERITFNPHADELIEGVDNGAAHIAFFLNPTKIQQILPVALSGNKMPPKSTYFYPKVLSGLVINKHEEA